MNLLNILGQHLMILLQVDPASLGATANEDFLFQNQKIYTVLVVTLLIFSGLVTYLFFSQRKISKLEQRLEILEMSSNDGQD